MNSQKTAFPLLVISTIGIIATGIVFYRFVEQFSWIDAYYFSIIALTT